MEFLLVILLIAVVASLMEAKSNKDAVKGEQSDRLVIQKKQCPPHQWYWQEIVDQDGNKQGERIVCKVCGPLSKSIYGGND